MAERRLGHDERSIGGESPSRKNSVDYVSINKKMTKFGFGAFERKSPQDLSRDNPGSV